MEAVIMSNRMHKFLAALMLYATSIIATSIVVGSLSQGFGLATAGWILGYAALAKLSRW
jgi:hypothetical protein